MRGAVRCSALRGGAAALLPPITPSGRLHPLTRTYAAPPASMEQPPDPEALPQPSADLLAPDVRRQRPRRPPRPREPRPDHFLALRLSHSPPVTAAVAAIQASIAEHSPDVAPALIDPAAAHLTLGVLSLLDAAAREAAAAALAGAAAAARIEYPISITLRGLGDFRNEVVWLGVGGDGGGDAALAALAAAVRGHFREAGLLLQADREFVPHVTVAKLSKMQPWGGGGGSGGGGRDGRWKRRRGQGRGQGQAICEQAENDEDASEAAGAAGPREVEDASAAGGAPPSTPRRLTIPPESYAAHADVAAAAEVAELQLCAMAGRRPGEYYRVVASCRLVAAEAGACGGIESMEAMEEVTASEAAAAAADGGR